MTRSFALTWDYRCPYGRIVHDHVVTALKAGADWNVRFLPFCLGQSHVEEGMPDIWDTPELDSGIVALQVGISVRDQQPEHFLDVHHALYNHRHNGAGNLRDRDVLSKVIEQHGADAVRVFADIDSGRTLEVVKNEHTQFVHSHSVWGVPTFVLDDKAVFVRLLDLADGDGAFAMATINRILDNIDWPILNEFKHTTVPR